MDDVRDAVRDFVARYNAEWLIEKNGLRSPNDYRAAWSQAVMRAAANATLCPKNRVRYIEESAQAAADLIDGITSPRPSQRRERETIAYGGHGATQCRSSTADLPRSRQHVRRFWTRHHHGSAPARRGPPSDAAHRHQPHHGANA